jgi:dienelactone hydrolase
MMPLTSRAHFTRSRRWTRVFLIAALALGCPLSAAGEQDRYTLETVEIELAGALRAVDVYRPQVTPQGVAIVAHGFTRSRVRHRDLGRALATAGIVAVIPDLPNVVNLWGNGHALAEFVEGLERGAVSSVAVTRQQVVLIGTSAGGLATVLAAAQLPGIAGWIGLDPVDRTGTGAHAAAQLSSPAVVMLAEPSLCNLIESGRAIAEALPRRLRTVEVSGASHCDFEDPTNRLCQAVCGSSSQETRTHIRYEIVTSALELLAQAAHRAADDEGLQ